MDKQAEIERIKQKYAERNKEIERQHRKEMARIIGGGVLQGASALPIFNIPYVGTGLGGALFEAGNAIMQGKNAKDIAKDAGKGFVVGETVGAIPYVGKVAGKTKAGQVVANQASNFANRLAETKIGQNIARKSLPNNPQIQNAIDKINNNPNKPLQELVYRNGEQVGYGDYFNYDDDAIYIDYLRNITKDTPNYQKGVGSEIVDKILQNNPNKNIIWDTVDDNAEAFKQAYLKKHPELTPYVFQQGDYDLLVALAKDQGYNINDYLELLREKSKKTGL